MNELTEKQQHYARYLAKLPAAQRNMLFSKMSDGFRAQLKQYIAQQVSQANAGLSAEQIAALEPVVRKMYLARIKKDSPLKFDFLKPMVDAQTKFVNEMMKAWQAARPQNIKEFTAAVNGCNSFLGLKELLDRSDDLISKKELVINDDEWSQYSNVVNEKVKLMRMEKAAC